MDPELRRQLSLSTEDLRFADNIVRQVESLMASTDLGGECPPHSSSHSNGPSSMSLVIPTPLDVWVEGVGWSGGEEWLRHQFRVYLLTMLRTSLLPGG
ncbi:late secretory pathway protein AVL9 homolog [Hyalella azteca]|uniref:Late secretory pathway protein AVL9 homolog n=1 Tax=Hyalella azteca TaxID=294128 RepID=A0A979FTN4_HYAAZ|nr:late secretory pathway protein AVL9 homolog [Hyalella azteca]